MQQKIRVETYKPRRTQKKAPRSRVKVKSVSKLVKELDAVFSRFIRVSHAKDGICTCYTCGHKAPIAKMHAGHYVSRFYKGTRWDPNNVRPQCPMCNLWKRGDAPTFRENLVKEIGERHVLAIEEARKISYKLTLDLLQQQINHYKSLLTNNK